jgi:hypothetical protein
MRSLLDLSARRDSVVDLADWVEISAFFRDDKSVSQEDLARSLVREGGDRSEDSAREKAIDAFNELAAREAAVGNIIGADPTAAYPFEIDGDLLKLIGNPLDGNNSGIVYAFLLAITRASMEAETRQLNGLDPTTVFEEVCAETLCQFWGGRSPLSDVFVTGTSNKIATPPKKRFPTLVDILAGHLCEGGGWKQGAKSPGAGDGGLDLAVWRRFHDKRPGGLVGFAQCKTGDYWKEHLGKHNPEAICHRFLREPLVLSPLPIYMVPCRVGLDEWVGVMREHRGVLFDRCRIANFGTHLPAATIANCVAWLSGAIDRERQELIKKGLLPDPAAAPAVAAPAVPQPTAPPAPPAPARAGP